MIKVGLTGGIGSGKTFVSQLFKNIGIPIYDSDFRAKHLMTNNLAVKSKIIEKFGTEAYTSEGLNRKYLSQHVFSDETKLITINEIVHPAVKTDFEDWCLKQTASPYVIKEAAILIESEAYKTCDALILVIAPIDIRIKRVMKRDNMTPDEVHQRIAKQLSDDEKIKHANFTIMNDGTMLVEEQVIKIHKQILAHYK